MSSGRHGSWPSLSNPILGTVLHQSSAVGFRGVAKGVYGYIPSKSVQVNFYGVEMTSQRLLNMSIEVVYLRQKIYTPQTNFWLRPRLDLRFSVKLWCKTLVLRKDKLTTGRTCSPMANLGEKWSDICRLVFNILVRSVRYRAVLHRVAPLGPG